MNFDSFFQEVTDRKLEITFDNPIDHNDFKLSNEALFHLPLIALTILIFACDMRKPKTSEIGQLVGECYERSFSGFKGSSQNLEWSANLRIRTVKAISFLEMIGMISIKNRSEDIIATDTGKRLKKQVLENEDELSQALFILRRNYRNIKVENQLKLEFS